MPEILKKSSKTGDRFSAISDLQNNEERVLFQAGNRQLSQKFLEQVYTPKTPKYSGLKGQGYSCLSVSNS